MSAREDLKLTCPFCGGLIPQLTQVELDDDPQRRAHELFCPHCHRGFDLQQMRPAPEGEAP
jgi:hypothetical protein